METTTEQNSCEGNGGKRPAGEPVFHQSHITFQDNVYVSFTVMRKSRGAEGHARAHTQTHIQEPQPGSRLVHLMEHELPWDAGLRAVQLVGTAPKRRHHLLHHFVEEDRGQLGVQQGAELEGDLGGADKKQEHEWQEHDWRLLAADRQPLQYGEVVKDSYSQKNPLCRSGGNQGFQG